MIAILLWQKTFVKLQKWTKYKDLHLHLIAHICVVLGPNWHFVLVERLKETIGYTLMPNYGLSPSRNDYELLNNANLTLKTTKDFWYYLVTFIFSPCQSKYYQLQISLMVYILLNIPFPFNILHSRNHFRLS